MTRRNAPNLEEIKKNLLLAYQEAFGKEIEVPMVVSMLDAYQKEKEREFILNRIEGLFPLEAKALAILLEKKEVIPEPVAPEEIKVNERVEAEPVRKVKGKKVLPK